MSKLTKEDQAYYNRMNGIKKAVMRAEARRKEL